MLLLNILLCTVITTYQLKSLPEKIFLDLFFPFVHSLPSPSPHISLFIPHLLSATPPARRQPQAPVQVGVSPERGEM